MINDTPKTVIWVNSAKEELLEFPEDVIDEIGYIVVESIGTWDCSKTGN
jgi:hypothetical protein